MPDFETLIDGYRRFRQQTYTQHRQRYDALTHQGQSPKVMVIACCDSRVDPTIVFDAEPGQMFVLRNVANLVPPYDPVGNGHGAASAALEFAVTQLQVRHVVILGHARCGGIHAALTGDFDRPDAGTTFVHQWMSMIREPRDQILCAHAIAPDMDAQRALELAAIRHSLGNLRTFPFIAAREAEGVLDLQGAFFDISDGILRILDPASDRFEPVQLGWEA